MTAIGNVIEVKENRARVQVLRESPCAGCKGCSGGSCHVEPVLFEMPEEEVTVLVETAFSVQPGDTVELYSDSRFTLGLAFVVFVLPFIPASLMGVLAAALFRYTVGAYVGVVSFILFFLLSAFLADRYNAKHPKTHIRKIIKESGQQSRIHDAY